jgi:tetratricopeptide (TPR) repeat protein
MMRKTIAAALLAACCCFGAAGVERTRLFEIASDAGADDSAALRLELELRFDTYNRLFRFSAASLERPLRVSAFADRAAYDRYVAARLGASRPGAVYLHYGDGARNELVVNRGAAEEPEMLAHQSFVQYLRAFVPNPPAWMLEGFAVYFNTLRFDPEAGDLLYEENLAWLGTVKTLLRSSASASASAPGVSLTEQALLADARGPTLQVLSWGLVSLFLNSGGDGEYFRSLTDSFLLLSPDGTQAENAAAVFGRLTGWTEPARIEADFAAYIGRRQTFADIVEAGIRAYGAADYRTAEARFLEAIYQNSDNYAPYYYLGLLAYAEGNHNIAEAYYGTALDTGGEAAAVNYALGVNAAAAGRAGEAADFLRAASDAAPDRYAAKAAKINEQLAISN